MEELMVGLGFIVVTWGVYSIFELFAHRKERLTLIEKLDMERLGSGVNLDFFSKKEKRNNALSIGLLLMGIGLGMFVGYVIYISNIEYILQLAANHSHQIYPREFKSVILGSCVLLFGGAALLTAYMVERKSRNRKL